MREWIQQLKARFTRDRRFFKPPVLPPAFDDPKTVIAFTDLQHCVAIITDDEPGEDGMRHEIMRVSFGLKTKREGKWAGVLELSPEAFRGLKELIDQANEYLEQAEDE